MRSGMSIPPGFTARQLRMWGLRRDGSSLASIARRLRVTRQAVSQAMKGIDEKVIKTLESTAIAAKIEVRHIDSERGVLLGYSHEAGDRVVVTLSTRNGVQMWHRYNGRCEECNLLESCMSVIIDEAEERGVDLTKEDREKYPAEIAHIVFSRVIPGLEP